MMQGKMFRWAERQLSRFTEALWRFCGQRVPEKQIDMMGKLYVGKNRKELQLLYLRKNVCYMLIGIAGVMLLSAMLCFQGQIKPDAISDGWLSRDEPGGVTKKVDLQVEAEQQSREVTLEIPPRTLSEEQIQQQFLDGKQYILETYLGENASAQEVSKSLVLVSQIPDSAMEVGWRLDNNGFVQEDGTLQLQDVEEPQKVEIVAQLSYGEEQEDIPLELTLLPEKRSGAEELWIHWKKAWEKCLQETENESIVQLPAEVDGVSIQYSQIEKQTGRWLCVFGILLVLLIPFLVSSRMGQQLQQRERELRRDYPEMIEQFVLLIGAGLTIKGAWLRMTENYQRQRKKKRSVRKILYEEMSVSVREMESGMSENRAYELFGKRMGSLPYMKFSTLLVQNLRKGSDDLLRLLEYEAVDAFRERKEHARKLGEEAGTKLLIPMMLMLIVVFAIILYAAFQAM